MAKRNATERKRRQRLACVEAQGGLCIYCGIELTFHYPNGQPCKTDATYEHLTPRSQGGGNHKGNRAASCYRCNTERGCTSHSRFLRKKRVERERNHLCRGLV